MIIGSHISIKNGYLGAVQQAFEDYKANALMTFLRSPRMARASKFIPDDEAEIVKKYVQTNKIFYVAHGIYLINFAKDLKQNKWALDIFVDDLKRIDKLGGVGVIVHMGKAVNDMDLTKAKENYIRSINHCIEAIKEKDLQSNIILENTAGQGTEFGYKFEEIKEIYDQLSDKRKVGLCLDTQHSFAAGYDWNKGVEKVFKEFDEILGLENLTLIHLNDSKKECGSRVDRHENLNKGLFKKETLKGILRFAHRKNIPLILETPVIKGDEHKKEIEWCKKQVVGEN